MNETEHSNGQGSKSPRRFAAGNEGICGRYREYGKRQGRPPFVSAKRAPGMPGTSGQKRGKPWRSRQQVPGGKPERRPWRPDQQVPGGKRKRRGNAFPNKKRTDAPSANNRTAFRSGLKPALWSIVVGGILIVLGYVTFLYVTRGNEVSDGAPSFPNDMELKVRCEKCGHETSIVDYGRLEQRNVKKWLETPEK